MPTEIFESKFTLKFKNKHIENRYEEERNKNLKKYNIIYAIINLIVSLLYTMTLVFTHVDSKNTFFHDFISYSTYVLTGIHGVILILSIATKSNIIQKWISHINLSVIFLNNVSFRIYLIYFVKVDIIIFTLIFITQQVYFMAWFYTNSLDFYEGFFTNLVVMILSYVYYAGVYPLTLEYKLLIWATIIKMTSFISYFYIYEKKKSFYLIYMNESNSKSYKSIIQNMNSGFISIKNSCIDALNKIIYSHLKKIQYLVDNQNNNQINTNNYLLNENAMIIDQDSIDNFACFNAEKAKTLLNELFKGIVIESLEGSSVYQSDYEKTLEYLKKYQNNNPNQNENFIFIGTKEFKCEDDLKSTLYYEIFGRYCDRFKQVQEDNYEFMFNDVSKTKISEEINAEIKYKTIFLSKVAHEFKNPLLCVSELIDQVNEELDKENIGSTKNSISKKKVRDTLTHIKSMCEYLLMLVKDLDFFSLNSPESTNKIKLEKHNVKLEKIIGYCDNITHVLLKKFQKEETILFSIDCLQELYNREIFTDEIRVNQLLINLLSNSVKYTFHGEITLQIKKENEEILFCVIDTGKGLSEEQIMRFNSNSIDNRVIGAYSSGLGFSIIKELISLLESQLDYESLGELGSKFSFRLNLVPNLRDISLNYLDNRSQNSISSILSEQVTVENYFLPYVEAELIKQIEELNIKHANEIVQVNKTEEHICLLKSESNTDYYLVVDDDNVTRKSTIRALNNYLNSKIINIRNKIILEASDGIECLNSFYQCIKKGIKLTFIISDQTMTLMNGESCASILNGVITINNLKHVPYFIVTAYENFIYNKESIDKSYTKPLTIKNIEEIFLLVSKI